MLLIEKLFIEAGKMTVEAQIELIEMLFTELTREEQTRVLELLKGGSWENVNKD